MSNDGCDLLKTHKLHSTATIGSNCCYDGKETGLLKKREEEEEEAGSFLLPPAS